MTLIFIIAATIILICIISTNNKNNSTSKLGKNSSLKETRQKNTDISENEDSKTIESAKEISYPHARHETIRAVLLTKSGKGGGACVAAYDMENRRFVRFVSNAETAAEIPFSDLRNISELDIVEVENILNCPTGPQSENILIRRNGIRKIGRYSGTVEDIRSEVLYPDKQSILASTENRIFNVDGFKHSLEIICVKNLELIKTKKYNGTYTTRANFTYKNKRCYDFRVTDFNFDLRKSDKLKETIPYADLVLSIPKAPYIYNGENKGYYKFIAAIFPIDAPNKNGIRQTTVIHKEMQTAENLSAYSEGRQHLRDMVPNSRQKSYEPWTSLEDAQLKSEFEAKMSINDMAIRHERSSGAITARLNKLGLK